MKNNIKDLWLAVSIMLILSLILLISDYNRRINTSKKQNDFPLIAIMQIASTNLLDTHVSGIISRLKENGLIAPDERNLKLFNPQGDFGMANTIAREIVNGPYDIVITSSTIALQIFANANQSIQKLHVFGGVTDPYGTGVGITGKEAHQHPPYLTGIGTFQPVKNAFILARKFNPQVKKIGVVWNSSEQSSEACTLEARKICLDLGIELVEGIALNTSEVAEALRSVISKGVEAIWIGGDTVASASVSMIINIAKQANIPVFTNDPEDAKLGALFGLGANYYTVGQYTADMATEVLRGKLPSAFKIENVVPEKLKINHTTLNSMRNWSITTEIEAMESSSENGTTNHKTYSIAVINFIDNILLEDAEKGAFKLLTDNGFHANVDFSVKKYNAQGDMSQLQQIIDVVSQTKPDVIFTITSPVLIATSAKIKDIPIVFTVASSPEKLKINQENVFGVYDNPPVSEMLELTQNMVANLKTVGIVYDPSQLNSIIAVEKLRDVCKENNIKLLEMTITSITDITMATQSLIQKGVQAFILSSDNLIATGFSAISKVASDHKIPIIANEPGLVEQGASAAIGVSYFEWGRQSGEFLLKFLKGQKIESPKYFEQKSLQVFVNNEKT